MNTSQIAKQNGVERDFAKLYFYVHCVSSPSEIENLLKKPAYVQAIITIKDKQGMDKLLVVTMSYKAKAPSNTTLSFATYSQASLGKLKLVDNQVVAMAAGANEMLFSVIYRGQEETKVEDKPKKVELTIEVVKEAAAELQVVKQADVKPIEEVKEPVQVMQIETKEIVEPIQESPVVIQTAEAVLEPIVEEIKPSFS